jgi:hypothetical protein
MAHGRFESVDLCLPGARIAPSGRHYHSRHARSFDVGPLNRVPLETTKACIAAARRWIQGGPYWIHPGTESNRFSAVTGTGSELTFFRF